MPSVLICLEEGKKKVERREGYRGGRSHMAAALLVGMNSQPSR